MKSLSQFTLTAVLFGSSFVFGQTELERLQSLCKNQETHISELEAKIKTLEQSQKNNPSTANSNQTSPTTKGADLNPTKEISAAERSAPADSGIAAAAPKTAESPSPTSAAESHKVQPGDTYSKISKKYGVSVSSLIKANPKIKPNALQVGQKITIPNTKAIKPKDKEKAETNTPTPVKQPSAEKTEANHKPTESAPSSKPTKKTKSSAKATTAPAPDPEPQVAKVQIEHQISYAEFAAQHGTTTEHINELNGHNYSQSTQLAKGSILYVPKKSNSDQPQP